MLLEDIQERNYGNTLSSSNYEFRSLFKFLDFYKA